MVSPARRSSLARSLIGIGAESHPRSGNPPIPSYYGVAPRRLLPGAGGAIEHVRGAGDLDAVRAALLTTFDGFTLDGDKLQPRPRREALLGFVEHRLGPHSGGESEWEPVFERVAVSMPDTTQTRSSPSQ